MKDFFIKAIVGIFLYLLSILLFLILPIKYEIFQVLLGYVSTGIFTILIYDKLFKD